MQNSDTVIETSGDSVDEPSTSPAKQLPRKRLPDCTLAHLGYYRLQIKAMQMGLSFVVLVLGGIIKNRVLTTRWLFFLLHSSCALVCCVLILALYCTSLYERAGKDRVKWLDFCITLLVGILFLLASFVLFETYNGNPDYTTAVGLGFLAGTLFIVDALTMGCSCLLGRIRTARNHNTQQESTTNPAGNQQQENQIV